MKKKSLIFFLLIPLLAGCNGGGSSSSSSIKVDSGYYRFELGKKCANPLVGFGAQIDSDVFMPWNNMSDDDTKLWEQRIQDMNLAYTRIKYFPEYLERENDNDDPNVWEWDEKNYGKGGPVDFGSAEMEAVYKVLDICEKYHVKVDLSLNGCSNFFKSYDGQYTSSWLSNHTIENTDHWTTAPNNVDEYVENFVMCLKYLLEVKKYTCIWGISNISELYYAADGVKYWSEYIDSCQRLRARLKKEGLLDKVQVIFHSMANDTPSVYSEDFKNDQETFDVPGLACYKWDYEVSNDVMYNFFDEYRRMTDSCNKKDIAICEFCEGLHFTDAVNKTDIDDYNAGMYIARFCIEAARAGVTAFDHYILGDCVFNNSYIHTMGLWMYRDSNVVNKDYISWAAHPEYYFYALLCKYTSCGSYCWSLDQTLYDEYEEKDPDVDMVAFENPDSTWSYYICNKSSEVKKVGIVNAQESAPTSMDCYRVTEARIPSDRNCDLTKTFWKTIDTTSKVAHVSVPANGMVVLTNRK